MIKVYKKWGHLNEVTYKKEDATKSLVFCSFGLWETNHQVSLWTCASKLQVRGFFCFIGPIHKGLNGMVPYWDTELDGDGCGT